MYLLNELSDRQWKQQMLSLEDTSKQPTAETHFLLQLLAPEVSLTLMPSRFIQNFP